MLDKIRNFGIIAHIDHGKSTLADRMIQHVGLVEDRDFRDQILDTMDIERERGITIKSQTVTLPYKGADGESYVLNLIDTPGHVDFSYEVSRALASCEGVLLLVDAAQGVEAQTVANLYAAMEHDLEIIPVINKIDLLSADVDRTRLAVDIELGLDGDEALACSAKLGTGVGEVFEAIVERVPAPTGDRDAPLAALIFDAHYDSFRGTIVAVRIIDGVVKPGMSIRTMSNDAVWKVEEVGQFKLEREPRRELATGEVGYIIAGIKRVADTRVGDTITDNGRPREEPLAGFVLAKPVVFSSIYPVSTDEYPALVDALEKYSLNDASLDYQKDSSAALGQGFRAGFLGLLHLEIFQERLQREFDMGLIMTMPSVIYRFNLLDGGSKTIDNPAYSPDPIDVESIEEPFIKANILMPERYLGTVMGLIMDRRGENTQFNYPSEGRIELTADMPLNEVIYDFYDKLKTITQGYGSFDYDITDYRKSDIVQVDILVNSEKVDALSFFAHENSARPRGLHVCERLQEKIPRHQFKVPIQGAIGGKIICRTTVNAFRKDVTSKCYGGDISRKRKLLEKQKKGKARMKMVGNVVIPQSAFVAVLKTKED